jgi:hypothetical protein
MGVELGLTLREEHRLRMFENRLLGEYLDLRGRKWREVGEDLIISFITCTFHQIFLGLSYQRG